MLNKLVVNRWSLIFIILIIIIASFLRLYNIVDLPPGLYPDEAMNGNNALEALSPNGQFEWFYPENNGREGLFMNIQALSVALFGNFPWALRLPSAIFGILTVLGIYFLAKELFSENPKSEIRNPKQILNSNVLNSKRFKFLDIALLSSFFLAVSFWHINFSRIGFRAIMAPAFLVWSVFLLLKTLNQTKKNFQFPISNFQTKLIFFSILGGLFYGLGFHSYIAYRATPLLILIIVLFYWLQNKEWQIRKKILLVAGGYTLMAFIVFAPLGYHFVKNPQDFMGRTAEVSVLSSKMAVKDLALNIVKTAGMLNFNGDYNWRHNYASKPELFWPVGILFLIGIFLGIKSIFRRSDFQKLPFLILFAWLIIAALPVVASNEGIPHALRSIIMIPPIFILAGIGGVWLMEKIKNQISKIKIAPHKLRSNLTGQANQNSKILKFIIHYSLFIILSLLVFEAYNAYFIKWGKNPNVQGAFSANYVQIGNELNSLPKETPKYVIVEAGGVKVRGVPMPAQTVMFITDTFAPEKQKEKNIYYVLPNQTGQIPKNAYTSVIR